MIKRQRRQENDKEAATQEKEEGVEQITRTRNYFMLPEFVYPRRKEREAAEKEKADAKENEDPVEWLWHEGGPYTTHPF